MKLKVMQVTTVHPSNDVRIFERICRSLLVVDGFQVELAAPPPSPSSNIAFTTLRVPSESRIQRIIHSNFDVFRIMKNSDVDVYHIHDPECLPAALLCSFLFKKKFVWDAHEDYLLQLRSSRHKRLWIPKPFFGIVQFMLKLLLSLVDRTAVGISCATSSIAKRYSNPNTRVIGNEARIEDFARCQPQYGTSRFLFIGKPTDTNLFREVVSAFSVSDNALLSLAWKEIDEESLQFAKTKLGNRFSYLGFLERKELAEAMSQHSFGIVSYANLLEEHGSQSTKFCEFAAAGLPVVCTPNGSLLSISQESQSSIVAETFSSDAFYEAIDHALKLDSNNWQILSRNARNWSANNGSWLISESELFNLYKSLMQN